MTERISQAGEALEGEEVFDGVRVEMGQEQPEELALGDAVEYKGNEYHVAQTAQSAFVTITPPFGGGMLCVRREDLKKL